MTNVLGKVALLGLFLGNSVAFASDDNPYFISKMNDRSGYSIDAMQAAPESICGDDDLQHIESYDNRYQHLGYNYDYVQGLGTSVGVMKSYGVSGKGYCSGTLIGVDEFLTASHCIDSGAVGKFVSFGYQLDATTGSVRSGEQIFTVTEVLEDGADFGLDYAVLRLEGTPGNTIMDFPGANGSAIGWKQVASEVPNDVIIVQHPKGYEKKVDAGASITYTIGKIRYADLDTEPGSSGSGVLNAQGEVVGVHTHGGCSTTSDSGSNSGYFMGDILAVSSVITLPVSSEPELVWPNGSVPVASSSQDGYPAADVGDGDLSTRWSAQNAGETITFDLGQTYSLTAINIAFLKGDARNTYFDLAISTDGDTFTTVTVGIESNGSTTDLESFDLSGSAQYVRIIGQGNSSNNWNSLTEVEIWGTSSDQDGPVALDAPTNLNVSVTGEGEIIINWEDNNDNEGGYLVEYARHYDDDENLLHPFEAVSLAANATNHTVTALADGWYYVRVSATAGNASTTNSEYAIDEWTEVTSSNVVLVTPENLTTTVTGAGEMTVTWDDTNSNETGYFVEYARYWEGEDELYAFESVTLAADTTSHVITGLLEDNWYYVRVSALNGDASSDYAIVEWTKLDFVDDVLTLSASSLAFEAAGASQLINVSSNVDWIVSFDDSWLSVDTASGSNDGGFTITADQNTSSAARSATITVRGTVDNGDSYIHNLKIEVTQVGEVVSGGEPVKLGITYEYASSDDGNVIANTLDGDLDTRWSAKGDGEFATYDLGSIKSVSAVNIAFFKGSSRNTYFSISVSDNGTDFTTFLSNETSSGDTTVLEEFIISTQARYVRIIGHGNSSNTWNSLTEVEIWGTEL